MSQEGEKIVPTPGQEPKEGLPTKPEEMTQREIKPITSGAQWLYTDKSELDQLKSPELKRMVEVLETTPQTLLTEDVLRQRFLQIQNWIIDGKVELGEAEDYLMKINTRIEDLVEGRTKAEPEIRRLERPKDPEEAVKILFDEVFGLHERGLTEGKGWGTTGGLYSEYIALEYWVRDIDEKWGRDDKRAEKINGYLGEALAREFPGGVALKEKLTLFLEAMKRLHNRQIEVVKADGGLDDLGAGKAAEPGPAILKVQLTNIRPVDWYILSHINEFFPESSSLETKIDLNRAWGLWQEIGKQPFEKKGEEWNFKKIQIGSRGYNLKDLYQSERVMAGTRDKIAKEVGQKIGNNIAGARAESLAYSLLTIGLTFDMWDRERWEVKGKAQARDLMWFDWKRLSRFRAARPAGPGDTVGCYWFCRGMGKDLDRDIVERLGKKEAARRHETLKKNAERAVFRYGRGDPSEGTIIGDFFHSTTFEGENGRPCRLSDVVSLDEIPWLEPGRFEEGTYEGYFGYSISIANNIEQSINGQAWKIEELKSKNFWTGLTDATLRLDNFCPWLIARVPSEELVKKFLPEKLPDNDRKKKEVQQKAYRDARESLAMNLVMKFRRILARGILWNGSYLAQSDPDRRLVVGAFSKDEVYGESFLGIKFAPGILDAIASSGYLDRRNLEILRGEVYDLDFYLKGRVGLGR